MSVLLLNGTARGIDFGNRLNRSACLFSICQRSWCIKKRERKWEGSTGRRFVIRHFFSYGYGITWAVSQLGHRGPWMTMILIDMFVLMPKVLLGLGLSFGWIANWIDFCLSIWWSYCYIHVKKKTMRGRRIRSSARWNDISHSQAVVVGNRHGNITVFGGWSASEWMDTHWTEKEQGKECKERNSPSER